VDRILLAQDRGQSRAAVNTLINLRFSQNEGYFRLRKLLLLKEDSGPSVRRQVLVNYIQAAVV